VYPGKGLAEKKKPKSQASALTFAAGETRKPPIVPLLNDLELESYENFRVDLSNPTGAGVRLPAVATVTIEDDEILLNFNQRPGAREDESVLTLLVFRERPVTSVA
jgi:hypothetical protein